MLEFFESVRMGTESVTSKESRKDKAYTGILHIRLDERDHRKVVTAGLSETMHTSCIRNG